MTCQILDEGRLWACGTRTPGLRARTTRVQKSNDLCALVESRTYATTRPLCPLIRIYAVIDFGSRLNSIVLNHFHDIRHYLLLIYDPVHLFGSFNRQGLRIFFSVCRLNLWI